MPTILAAELVLIGLGLESAVGAFLVTNATLIANVAVFSATVAGSASMQRRAKAKARAAYNASLKDREITFRSAVAPRRVIYGRDRVGGVLVFAQSTGTKKEFLHAVIALAAHECDAIEEVWFGDELLPTPDGSGWITSGAFGTDIVNRATHYATVSGGGTITLPQAASKVTDISRAASESVDGASYGGTHTPGSATISGLPAGESLTVGYEYGTPAQKVRIRKFLGAAGQTADADLVAASGGKWTTAHKGTGICYLYVMLKFDPEMFANFDLSRIMCTVRGKKVPDPRTGTTVWTDNAALITADWLKDATYGMRASAGEVPSAEVIAAANICDELVTLDAGGATQKRYTYNGSFSADQAPRDVLEDLLSSLAGHCVWTQGRWLLRPGAYRTPGAGAEITEDHLADGGVTVTPKVSRSALFNAVRVTYRDPSQGWAQVQAPLVTNATYVTQDGGVQVVRDITMPGAMDALRAQRLGKIELERGRQAVTVQATTNLRAYDYAPTDTTLLILPRYGWGSGKVFEVIDRTWSPEGTLRYTWRETASAVYAWAYGEATVVDPAPDTDLPSPYTRPAALGTPTLASGTAQLWRQADGTIISRAYITWPASVDQFVIEAGAIELQWSAGGSEDWLELAPMPGSTTEAWIAPVPDGQALVVRLRQRNPLGVRSNWAYVGGVVVGKTAAPGSPSSFAGAVNKGQIRWTWAPLAEIDYSHTEVRSANTGWGGSGALWVGTASQYLEPVAAAAALTRYVKHFDTSGNQSNTAATATATVTAADLIETIAADVLLAQAAADAKIASFYQASPPGVFDNGDLWFDTDDGNKQYVAVGGSWTLAADTRIGAAVLAASDAQATADGKVVTFVATSAPTAEAVGDLWLDSDDGNKLYRWNGSAWVALPVGTAAIDADAVTKVHTATASAVSVTGEKGSPTGTFTTLASLTFTPPVSCEVLLSVEGTVSITTASSGALGDYAMLSTRVRVNGTLVGPLRNYAIDIKVGFSTSASAMISRALSFAATGGVAYTVELQGQQYVVATTCNVDDVRLRAEEIRR